MGLWVMSLMSIPKESSPSIELGLITVNTVYVGASPQDIDELVTKEIESSIESVEWIDKIESTSSTNVSSILITLDEWYNVDKAISDIKAEVDKAILPEDAEDPNVSDITTDTDSIFNLIIYADPEEVWHDELMDVAKQIEFDLEWIPSVDKISINAVDSYDIRIVVNQTKAEQLWLDTNTIAQTIRWYVNNTPLGSFEIETSSYDFRINKTIVDEKDLLSLSVPSTNWPVLLWSIASIERYYDEDIVRKFGEYQNKWYQYVALNFTKSKSVTSVQTAAEAAKEEVVKYMQKFEKKWISYTYGQDIAVGIKESYDSVTNNGLITLILVFFSVLLFVSLKESIIATLSIPLAFFITFFVFNLMGSSLNFMTNFSMIVTFGIAIDTIIVILEWAAEKKKMWYSPYSAALLSLHEFKTPLIAATATTCVVFIPLFTLPGTLGKFLSFIPITIFITLVGALIISLLVNPTMYFLFNKNSKVYIRNKEEEYLSIDEKQLLDLEREGKQEVDDNSGWWRHRIFGKLVRAYERLIRSMVYASRGRRWFYFLFPILLFVLSNMLPIKTIQFPQGDADYIAITITWPAGSHHSYFEPYLEKIDDTFSQFPEVENFTYSAQWSELGMALELKLSDVRSKEWLKNSFDLTDDIVESLTFLEEEWMTVDLLAEAGWPPQWKAVWVDLIAQNNNYFDDLQTVAKDFEDFFKEQENLIEISNSNKKTAGQFVFSYDTVALKEVWLTPGQVNGQVALSLNGRNAWSIASQYDDHDIQVLYETYRESVSPGQIEDLLIASQQWQVRLGDLVDYTTESNINAIRRKDGQIVISIGADVAAWLVANDVEPLVKEFADNYSYPTWVSYSLAGENAENASVNSALWIGLMVALFMIFIILLLQFNSFRMPLFIFYAILMALMGANVWLFITGNPRSLAFNIWFISLMWIVVNDAIVFIDRINTNIRRGMDRREAIIEWWKSRLQPIILTTVTTILWLSSVVREDVFFAGLGYTIIFWLFVGSLMTLLIIPVIYTMFVGEKKVQKMRIEQ